MVEGELYFIQSQHGYFREVRWRQAAVLHRAAAASQFL
ncbi:hypothetical protein CFter6_4971 [Collimonas fungivorans]|uniref:Uncharacterized protein n=1 Tax=Collimonas fungivorans TaxID=158899 RepID=A0A127PIK4_9BURK|nr:hypothetical protein CFter6_4971 [Collimonas fungivorans]